MFDYVLIADGRVSFSDWSKIKVLTFDTTNQMLIATTKFAACLPY